VTGESGWLYSGAGRNVSIPIEGPYPGGRVSSEWHKRAACKGATHLFFSYDEEIVAHARQICEDCPVRHECLLTGLADRNLYGVWGGTTDAERRRFRRRRVA
jgi:WhiB family transcriptional regulator, redox-sensing transcriptional regulator